MKSTVFSDHIAKLDCLLDLKRRPVGIRFLYTEEEYSQSLVTERTGPICYCVMVQMAASHAREFKVRGKYLSCAGGAVSLGFQPVSEQQSTGYMGQRIGLYHDKPTAKQASDVMSYCPPGTVGLIIRPLERFIAEAEEPDVVVLITEPYNIMRMVQGYSYYRGAARQIQTIGNQGICSELTARPYVTNDLNVSMLCSGTRSKAAWCDGEMGIGFPFSLFPLIVEGLLATADVLETYKKKEGVQEKLKLGHFK